MHAAAASAGTLEPPARLLLLPPGKHSITTAAHTTARAASSDEIHQEAAQLVGRIREVLQLQDDGQLACLADLVPGMPEARLQELLALVRENDDVSATFRLYEHLYTSALRGDAGYGPSLAASPAAPGSHYGLPPTSMPSFPTAADFHNALHPDAMDLDRPSHSQSAAGDGAPAGGQAEARGSSLGVDSDSRLESQAWDVVNRVQELLEQRNEVRARAVVPPSMDEPEWERFGFLLLTGKQLKAVLLLMPFLARKLQGKSSDK